MTGNWTYAERLLGWYVERLDSGTPFTNLLYGDGEFLVAAGERTGGFMQNDERVSKALEAELLASLAVPPEPNVVYATDPNLLDPDRYGGRDVDMMRVIGRQVNLVLDKCPRREWVDGVVWERAVREGAFGPFLKALRRYGVTLVGHKKLAGLTFLNTNAHVGVPPYNAAAAIDDVAARVPTPGHPLTAFVVCCGVSAIPLIRRLRARYGPDHVYLDLGSTFDVFCGLGADRGWRAELYADKAALRDLISRNLEGVPQ